MLNRYKTSVKIFKTKGGDIGISVSTDEETKTGSKKRKKNLEGKKKSINFALAKEGEVGEWLKPPVC